MPFEWEREDWNSFGACWMKKVCVVWTSPLVLPRILLSPPYILSIASVLIIDHSSDSCLQLFCLSAWTKFTAIQQLIKYSNIFSNKNNSENQTLFSSMEVYLTFCAICISISRYLYLGLDSKLQYIISSRNSWNCPLFLKSHCGDLCSLPQTSSHTSNGNKSVNLDHNHS